MPATLISVAATVTSASMATISLRRSGVRSSSLLAAGHGLAVSAASRRRRSPPISGVRQPQHVPDAPDRVQQPRLDGVDLAAEVGDVRLDDAAVAAEVVVPHVVED